MDNKPVPPTHLGYDLLNHDLWRDHKWENDPEILIFPDKYVVGGENAGIVTTASKSLTTQFESDVHFVQYTHSTEARLRKDTKDIQGLKFEVCCFDLDNHDKHPTQENFDELMSYLEVWEEKPNVAYKTRGGARLMYFIQTMTDPIEYEEHWAGLRAILKQSLINHDSVYQVDDAAKDWTRFFRMNWVMREDDNREAFDTYHEHCYFLHSTLFNLTACQPIKKKVYRAQSQIKMVHKSPLSLQLAERYVRNTEAAISGAGGHNRTFKVCCCLLKNYMLSVDDARPLLEIYNERCDPLWSERDLEHKLADAARSLGREYTK